MILARQPIILVCAHEKVKKMDSLIDPVILTTAVVCSFGIAFMAQRAVLRLILKAMNRRSDLARF